MKTSTTAPPRPRTTLRLRLRHLTAVAVVAPAIALAACSGEPAVTADPTAPAGATTPAATATTSTDAATTSDVPTTAASTTLAPVKYSSTTINAVIKDPVLGHTITALKLVRGLPFPANQPVGAEAFEIVGVKVQLQAGSRYSADIEPAMLSLIAADPQQNIQPTAEFGKAFKAAPLAAAKRDSSSKGWIYFKVNRGTTTALRLAFNRPSYQVSTTDKNIPSKTFSVVLSK
ncbi:hypothetical protein [Intrasporangium mesophilum]